MRQNGHPSKQTFQAIRIECNRELEVLRDSLEDLVALLNPGGRLCVVSRLQTRKACPPPPRVPSA